MHLHFLGICGTFMGSLAILARELGHRVTGSDANVYPPMSTQLEAAGIEIYQGYDETQFAQVPDLVIIGNAMSRGNPAVEYVLNRGLAYTSGPAFLAEHVLVNKWVLAVAGTHGKTTTTTMLAWVLEQAGMQPGFLIGGVPLGFTQSARLGGSDFFVIEADEYDSAFFDKRSKFVHYRPRTLVLNNLEFDHADIFDDLAAIERQFHHVVRTVPSEGQLIVNESERAFDGVLAQGVWTPVLGFGGADSIWRANKLNQDGSRFEVLHRGEVVGVVDWQMSGDHSVSNGLAAIAAAHHVGVLPEQACAALSCFGGVKRRLEKLYHDERCAVYDDFAHHPTAITTTVEGLRKRVGSERIIAVLEPRSNTMRMGVFKDQLAASWSEADCVYLYQPANVDWSLADIVAASTVPATVFSSIEELVAALAAEAEGHFLIMSNGGFGGIHQKLIQALTA